MFSFYNRDLNYFLSTNTKVLTRTLLKQGCLERVGNWPMFLFSLFSNFRLSKTPHYFLVRNPYDRVESFFKEKLRQKVLQTTSDPPYILKLHQQIFYPFAGVLEQDPVPVIQQKLLELSFQQYIKALPQVYLLDEHLRPQAHSLRRKLRGMIPFTLPVTRFFPIEQSSTMMFMTDQLKLNIGIHENPSVDMRNEIAWTAELRKIVNDLYRDDFRRFQYGLKNE